MKSLSLVLYSARYSWQVEVHYPNERLLSYAERHNIKNLSLV